jgi:hypothetical protein
LDDVAAQTATDARHLIQSKSALGDNPVSDRATSLWKTLFNWLELVKRGFVQPARTTFELYVSRPVSGPIVDSFNSAQSETTALKAIDEARKTLWGDGPTFPLRSALSNEIAIYVNSVLGADDALLIGLVKNVTLTCGSGSPQADLEAIVRSHPVSPSRVSTIAAHMQGWVKQQVDTRLEQSLPAFISTDEFHKVYTAYCRAVDRDMILRSYAPTPTKEQVVARLPDVFVQQLDLIALGFEEKLEAVSDWLKASADRTHWAQAGDVDETSFDEFDETLTRAWHNRERTTSIEHRGRTEAEIGQLLYLDCMRFEAAVQGMQPPAHFVPGCFHCLSEVQRIGWHPDFRTLLKIAKEREST